MTEPPEPVLRPEFEAHQKRVSSDIESLVEAIRGESKARARDTADIRADIKALAAAAGRPQYQALGFAFGVFAFVIGVLAGVYSWGESRVGAERALRLVAISGDISKSAAELREHEKMGGHAGALNIEGMVDDLRRDVDRDRSALAATLKELDDKLQKEVDAAREYTTGQFNALNEKLQGEIAAADHESAGRHDVQAEKLRAIEREVFGEDEQP